MARTDLAAQTIVRTGLNPTYTAANVDGHAIANRGRQVLHVKNGSGASIDVTIVTAVTVGGRAVADDVIAVPAAGERIIGPFDEGTFNDGDGKVAVNFSAVTTVTVAALQL